MEATVVSVGKSVLDGALGYAKSAVAEEVALQLGVQRDHAFIRDELEMMRSFLMAAHEERDGHKVLITWVKQVRDVAYDAEDCLQDFSVHLKKPSWWRLRRTLRERHRIAKQMKELRARVEDVSQRNQRYQLMKGSSSKPATTAEQSSVSAAAIFGIDGAQQEKSKEDLVRLISKDGEDLGVIAVWGTNGDLGQTSVVRAAYENPDIRRKFSHRAWVRVLHPFNPKDFIHTLLKQFRSAVGGDILLEMEKTGKELAEEFNHIVNENSFLIVLNNLSTIEEWDGIKTCFPSNKKGSRIIVCTTQLEVASICAGQDSMVSELKQLSADQTIYAFYEKVSQDGTDIVKSVYKSDAATTSTSDSVVPTDKITENQSQGADEKKAIRKSLTRTRTIEDTLEESGLVGRDKEKSDMIELIQNQDSQQLPVISVWGMGGLGKTSLVNAVYQSEKLSGMFEKRAFVTVMRPFDLEELLRSLALQLHVESSAKKAAMDFVSVKRKPLAAMAIGELKTELGSLFERNRCLVIIDDLSSTAEWDLIKQSLHKMGNKSLIITTTREKNIATHCSDKQENIYMLKVLEHDHALDLFKKKVFKECINLDEHPELLEQAKLILKKCDGLPLAIAAIGGFLANQPKTAIEWRKLNGHISAELDMNSKLETIRTVLIKSYDGLPYHLKSCFLYLSIFPEGHMISRKRLIRRWVAEGYSRDIREKSAEEIADSYFMELIDRSMVLQSRQSIHSRKAIDSCKVHDIMREIDISKSTEENLVFRLGDGCSSNTHGTVRHLSISNNWKGDKSDFESAVDLSRIRSLTVFGKWRPFFISNKMRLLRVLDLEGTCGLVDHHLGKIEKLLHLKYLCLRGCDIWQLPDSFGNMRQLETLDVTDTCIIKLPKTIIKLRKLKYLRGARLSTSEDYFFSEVMLEDLPKLLQNKLCLLTIMSVVCCVACCAPQILDADLNRCDLCTICCSLLPLVARNIDPFGVVVPRGIWRLKALHTLGVVNVSRGRVVLREIKKLTGLRKLGVTGVNMKNRGEFCSALSDLSNLESLLVRSEGEPGLRECLDGLSSPPKNLQSLKLYGNLVKLPEWIGALQNLVKLTLRSSRILEFNAAIEVLGKLPILASLRLWARSFQSEDLRFTFHRDTFPSLMVLELKGLHGLRSVRFEERAMLQLERLDFCGRCDEANNGLFSGLASLEGLKEFLLDNDEYKDEFVKDVRDQLQRNGNGPVLIQG